MTLPIGTLVHVDLGDGNGVQFGIVAAHGQGGTDSVVPLGHGEQVGHREPKDRDEHGSGRTYWNAQPATKSR